MTLAFCDLCLIELNKSNRFHRHEEFFALHPNASKDPKDKLSIAIFINVKGLATRDAHLCKSCLKVNLIKTAQNI